MLNVMYICVISFYDDMALCIFIVCWQKRWQFSNRKGGTKV